MAIDKFRDQCHLIAVQCPMIHGSGAVKPALVSIKGAEIIERTKRLPVVYLARQRSARRTIVASSLKNDISTIELASLPVARSLKISSRPLSDAHDSVSSRYHP